MQRREKCVLVYVEQSAQCVVCVRLLIQYKNEKFKQTKFLNKKKKYFWFSNRWQFVKTATICVENFYITKILFGNSEEKYNKIFINKLLIYKLITPKKKTGKIFCFGFVKDFMATPAITIECQCGNLFTKRFLKNGGVCLFVLDNCVFLYIMFIC